VRLFKALLSDPRIETLMKGGEIEVILNSATLL